MVDTRTKQQIKMVFIADTNNLKYLPLYMRFNMLTTIAEKEGNPFITTLENEPC